jgi:hypothetical protein
MRECPHCQFLVLPGSPTCRFCGQSLLLPPPDPESVFASPGAPMAAVPVGNESAAATSPRRWAPILGGVALIAIVATVGVVAVGGSGGRSNDDASSATTTTLSFAPGQDAVVPDTSAPVSTIDLGDGRFAMIGTRVDPPLTLTETIAPTGDWAVGFPGEPKWIQTTANGADLNVLRYNMPPFAALIASEILTVDLDAVPPDDLLRASAAPFTSGGQCTAAATEPADGFGGRVLTVEATCGDAGLFAATFVAIDGRLFSLSVEGGPSSGPEYFRMRLKEFSATFRLVR